jgi:hypothetical protein
VKTVKQGAEYKRVSDEVAETMVAKGWKYCPKEEWKMKVRDAKNSK